MASNNRQLRKNNHRSSVKLLQRADNGPGAFADASVDAFLMLDENLNLVSINLAGEKLLGLSLEADAGKNIIEIVPDIKKTGRYGKYLSVIETGKPFFADDIIPHPRFGNKHFSIKAFKVWDGIGMIVNDITERKGADEALQRAEEKLRLYLDNSPDAIYISDLEGNFKYVNKAAERITGYPRQELLNKSFLKLDLLPQEYLLKAAQLLELNRAGKAMGTDEFELVRKDGSRVSVEISTYPMGEGDGIEVIGIARDITGLKKAEEALQQERDKLELFTSDVGIGLAIISKDYHTLWANGVLRNIFGDVERGHCYSTYNGQPDICPGCGVRQVFEMGKARVMHEQVGNDKEGNVIWSQIVAIPIKDKAGNITSALEAVMSITERKKMEQALRESEWKYRDLFNNAEVALFRSRIGDGKILECNDLLAKLFGYDSREQCIAEHVTSEHYVDPKVRARILTQMLDSGEVSNFEALVTRRDSSPFWVSHSARIYPDRDCIEGAIVDITERKKAEEALRQSEELYATMANSSLVGIYIVQGGKFVFVNPQFQKETGFSADELLGMDPLSIVHPEDREMVRENAVKMLKGELSSPCEYRTIDKSGRTRVVMERVAPIEYRGKRASFGCYMDITERNKSEEALKLSEERHRLVVENANEAIVVAQDGTLKFFNSRAIGILGYSKEEMASRPFIDLIHPDDQQIVANRYMARLRGEKLPPVYSFRVIDNTGNVRWAEINAVMINWEGRPATLNFLTDITERKKAEEALKLSEERYRLLVENASEAILVAQEGVLRFFNTRLIEIVGYSREELASKPLIDFVHPADQAMVRERYTAMMERKERSSAYCYRAVTQRGNVRWLEISAVMINWEGRPATLNLLTDITERKKAEEALKLSEERYRLLVENAGEAIVVAQDGMLKFFNSRTREVSGYSNEELASKPFIELVHPDDQEIAMERHLTRNRGGSPPPLYSLRFVGKTGNIRWVENNWVAFTWEGRPATLNFLTDVTERKNAEEEKQRMEEQLLLAGRLAAVGELAAGVAHELNNPLAIIQMYSESSKGRGDLDDTAKKDLLVIYEQAKRASKITRNLLSFARKHGPEKSRVSVNEIIEKTLQMRSHQLSVNNIEVSEELQPGLPMIMADYNQMQQVFMNIIINAEQAMLGTHGRGKLNIKTQTTEGMIKINFADDGPGISEGNLKRIFDPFFTTKEVGKGTGLGLSICYGIVQNHGGHIYAVSKMGEGATFVIEIPIASECKEVSEIETHLA